MTESCLRKTAPSAAWGLVIVVAAGGCTEAARSQPSTDRDAGVTSSALVTVPATWTNLWGSWPAGRYQHAAAYDTDRKLLVMYGGQASTSGPYFDDIWEWDGARGSWAQRTALGSTVGTRSGHAMVYDAVSQRTFMFSGWQPAASFYIQGQWEWDGPSSTWTFRDTIGAQPDPRRDHAMVYDSDRQKVVLFGGWGGPGTDETGKARLGDVWDWDGATRSWTQRTPTTTTNPAPRFGHCMAYDSIRKKVVVRGGNTGTNATGTWVNETWEWDGISAAWAKVTTTGTAPAYSGYAGYDRIAFDVSRGKTVLYEYFNNVYELDPVTPAWTAVTTTFTYVNEYPGYGYPTVNYDPARGNITLFGGQSYSRVLTEYTSADATLLDRSTPVNGPIQRQNPAIAFDNVRGKLMLFGGYRGGDTNPYKQDILQWSGSDPNWTNLTTLDAKPAPRYQAAMVYDTKRDQLLMFGGTGAATYDDLWSWAPATKVWTQITFNANAARPTARYGHFMFYDRARDKVLVYGGTGGQQIWEYDPDPAAAVVWKDRTPSPIPAGVNRSYYDVTFDVDRSKMVLIGGYYGGVYDTDVWEWDATVGVWGERPIAAGTTAPVGRYYHTVSYDMARRLVVLVGGHAQVTGLTTQLNDSWEWDGATATWTETTPPGVKPLPRENHLMVFNEKTGTTMLFGGTVSADSTYGPQEIWEYAPNSAPRPNGAACSAATASHCQSGFCVDGVCCATATCAGTCKSCNVPGSAGTCSDVRAGAPDDSCASDQACDANHLCKSRNGQACAGIADCASGHCADGFCCDSDCTDTCKACNLNSARGVCSNMPANQEDPVGAPACASEPNQGRFCDGNGVCTNASKANGLPCTAGGQCTSTFCIDGVCCNSACSATCYTCNRPGSVGNCSVVQIGLQDHSAAPAPLSNGPCDGTMQYCNGSGTCAMNKKPNGGTCSAAGDCGSNLCVDGRCCNSACTGTCQACNVPGKEGSCVNVVPGTADAPGCPLPQYCDTAGTCQSGLKANGSKCAGGSECGTGFCADGFCCDTACTNTCYTCSLSPGTCSGVPAGAADPVAGTPCMAPNYCTAVDHVCTVGRKPNGAVCASDTECGSSFCVDKVCCETACSGSCRTCANPTGTCALVADGQDPRTNCGGAVGCAGTCDGLGGCRYPAAGIACGTSGCASDGVIHQPGTCDGAGHCAGDVYDDCNGFKCFVDNNVAKCRTTCDTDPNCQDPFFCDDTQRCPADYPNGHSCDRDDQCQNNHCALPKAGGTGVCCDRDCKQCGTCNLPGKEGICVPTPANTDPDHDCIFSQSDPTGQCGGRCNGQWACEFPAAGTVCGQCKGCDGSGKCNVTPEDDDSCGDIDCDQLDDNVCKDYHDLKSKRCGALGACKTANTVETCTDVTLTCGGDAGSGSDAITGIDAGPPKGGGGGCCAVAGTTAPTGAAPLLLLFMGAPLILRRKRR